MKLENIFKNYTKILLDIKIQPRPYMAFLFTYLCYSRNGMV